MAAVTTRDDFDGTGRTDRLLLQSILALVTGRSHDELEEASMADSTANRLFGF
jgi:hypothetical protein